MLGPSHWLHEISLPKRLGHHFWPGLTSLAKNTLPTQCWGTFDFLKKKAALFFKHFRSREMPVLDRPKPWKNSQVSFQEECVIIWLIQIRLQYNQSWRN
jgi:hypothetical protein